MSTQHLTDLFRVGSEVTITVPQKDGDPIEVPIYMRKPTVGEQQQARERARAAQHRRKREFRDPESAAYMSLWEEIESFEDKDELLDAVVRFDEAKLRTQAYNDTLFAEDYGSDWGKEGEVLMAALDAVQKRWSEIERHNALLSDDDVESRILPGEDEELQELRKDQARFESEVEERFQYLLKIEKQQYKGRTADALRKLLVKKSIDLEGDSFWLQEYRLVMLWNAARNAEDRKKRYFSSSDDVLELPQWVQTQLFDALDALDRADSKNSASPQLFSA